MTVQIPLMDDIKEVPKYTKEIREACIKQLGRKRNNPQIFHLMGKLSDLMLDEVSIPKYSDLGGPIVTIFINGVQVQNDLVDLGS